MTAAKVKESKRDKKQKCPDFFFEVAIIPGAYYAEHLSQKQNERLKQKILPTISQTKAFALLTILVLLVLSGLGFI